MRYDPKRDIAVLDVTIVFVKDEDRTVRIPVHIQSLVAGSDSTLRGIEPEAKVTVEDVVEQLTREYRNHGGFSIGNFDYDALVDSGPTSKGGGRYQEASRQRKLDADTAELVIRSKVPAKRAEELASKLPLGALD